MQSFPISRDKTSTVVDEEDAWRFKEAHYHLKKVSRPDGTVRQQYAYHDVNKPSHDGLPVRYKSRRIKKTRIFLHKEILEDKLGRLIRDGYMTDHVDGGGLNNVRSNLREATNGQNVANQRKRPGATSTSVGVSKHRPSGRWQVQVKKDKKPINLGYYDTEFEADQVRKAAAHILHGLHFPDQLPADLVKRVTYNLRRHGLLAPSGVI